MQNELEIALEYYTEALDIKENTLELNHIDFVSTYSNIGEVYAHLNMYD